jgi:hypothetical protein
MTREERAAFGGTKSTGEEGKKKVVHSTPKWIFMSS